MNTMPSVPALIVWSAAIAAAAAVTHLRNRYVDRAERRSAEQTQQLIEEFRKRGFQPVQKGMAESAESSAENKAPGTGAAAVPKTAVSGMNERS